MLIDDKEDETEKEKGVGGGGGGGEDQTCVQDVARCYQQDFHFVLVLSY